VDQRVTRLAQQPLPAAARWLLELGLQHEQQHQELLLTDVLHLFSCNALEPAYVPAPMTDAAPTAPAPLPWQAFDGGLVEIGQAAQGCADGSGFAFDNETPRHRHWLAPYALAQRLVTQGEWADFIADGGYRDPRWWLSAGWDWVQANGVQAPLYWRREDRGFSLFGLHGRQPLQPAAPVLHLSFYEAEAYARWAGAQQPGTPPPRLPTEAEWEHAAAGTPVAGNLLETGALGPRPAPAADGLSGLQQLWGDAWEWTRSAYAPYPGYRPWDGAVGEYNGKFMADQFVLRGGSFATPRSHLRASYRNFFPAPTRWQFAGLRLARDGG
jgi:ergothioneine biosynthesis protein EgtB